MAFVKEYYIISIIFITLVINLYSLLQKNYQHLMKIYPFVVKAIIIIMVELINYNEYFIIRDIVKGNYYKMSQVNLLQKIKKYYFQKLLF